VLSPVDVPDVDAEAVAFVDAGTVSFVDAGIGAFVVDDAAVEEMTLETELEGCDTDGVADNVGVEGLLEEEEMVSFTRASAKSGKMNWESLREQQSVSS